MIETKVILNFLRDNKDRLSKNYHLTKLGLFGSIARGEQDELSDIDIIVEFEPNTNDLYNIKAQLREEIQSQFDKPVDICRLKYIKPFFRDQIQSEVLYV